MSRVLLVPKLLSNLISVGRLCFDSNTVVLTKDSCNVMSGATVVGHGKRKGRLCILGIQGEF